MIERVILSREQAWALKEYLQGWVDASMGALGNYGFNEPALKGVIKKIYSSRKGVELTKNEVVELSKAVEDIVFMHKMDKIMEVKKLLKEAME